MLISAGAHPDSLIPEDTFSFDAAADEMPLPSLLATGEQDAYLAAGALGGGKAGGGDSPEGDGARFRGMEIDLTGDDDAALNSSNSNNNNNSHSSVNAMNGVSGVGMSGMSGVGGGVGGGEGVQELVLSDGMTDEQLAEFLSSTYS